MKLHMILGVKQKTAWYLTHRIRKSFESSGQNFTGIVEADESYFSSLEKNKHKGTLHKIRNKHLHHYVSEFSGRHNLCELDTLMQIEPTVSRLVGKHKQLNYADLIGGINRRLH